MPMPARSANSDYIRTEGELIVRADDWNLLTRNIEKGKTTLLVGPPGCGKTRLAIEAAEALGRQVEVFHFGGVFDPEPAFHGTTVLRNGDTQFVRSRFAESAPTPNRALIFDEISRTPGSIQNAVLSLCDFQRRTALDLADDGNRTIELAPGNAVIATGNVGQEYVHTEQLDPALLSRMLVIRLDYPEDERPLLIERGLDKRSADKVMRATGAVRLAYAKQTISATVTTRALTEIAELIADGFALPRAFEAAVGVLDPEEVAALRTVLKAA